MYETRSVKEVCEILKVDMALGLKEDDWQRRQKKDGKNHIYGRSVGRNSGCYYFAVQIVISQVVMRVTATPEIKPNMKLTRCSFQNKRD